MPAFFLANHFIFPFISFKDPVIRKTQTLENKFIGQSKSS